MPKYRIKEVEDSQGKKMFIPQVKRFWLWWSCTFYHPEAGSLRISFKDLKTCQDWITYEEEAKVIYHEVGGKQ